MRARPLSLLAAALLLAFVLPLIDDAAEPVPSASKAPCCNTFDQAPPPVPTGDEAFFNIPGGVPNLMLLLDNSGSMGGLPRDLVAYSNAASVPTYTYPGTPTATGSPATHRWSTGGTFRGTCGLVQPLWLNARTPKTTTGLPDTTRAPYDNGYNNDGGAYETIDDPPWGLKRCEARQARPATDRTRDYCLFRPDSYYKVVNNPANGGPWDDTWATVYNANPCAAVTSAGGALVTNYDGTITQADNLAECQSCLATEGFYVMNPRQRTGVASYANTANQVVFAGWFLNAYPPKYVAARKVVKDVVRFDATSRPNTDMIRFGLSTFAASNSGGLSTSLRAADGGALVVPLGPDCDSSFPVSRPAFATARQAIITAINTQSTAGWDATRYVQFGTTTPLSESLFNVGQYFTNTGTAALYNSLFGAGWVRASFAENQPGTVGTGIATWAAAGKNQRSFCWACQQSSIVVVTDGEPNQDSNLPSSTAAAAAHSTFNGDFRYWSNPTVDCVACGCDQSYSGGCRTASPMIPASGSIPNALHKVAYFLKQTDLRPDLVNGARPQNVSTYTISFGIDTTIDAKAYAVLRKTAELGTGDPNNYISTADPQELAAALDRVVTDVVARTTSFSSANANSLQTSKTTSADAYLGRFRPLNGSIWEGHLFAAQIFDEFGEGCSEAFPTGGQKLFACGAYADRNPNLDGDEFASGMARCSSSYVVDKDCDPVVEDSTGNFKKAHFDPTTHQLLSDPDDAVLHWDAGKALSDPANPGYRSAVEDPSDPKRRVIYTVIDRNADGKFTAADGLVEFTADNAAAIGPLMNLPLRPPVAPVAGTITWNCATWLNQIGICGSRPGLVACPAGDDALRTMCAAQLIHFYRGWDVMDQDADHCAGPGNFYNTGAWDAPATCAAASACGGTATCDGVTKKCKTTGCPMGEQRDRVNDSRAAAAQEFWKLGDIFHSSPVLVRPPVSKSYCRSGAFNQCVLTLYSGTGASKATATRLEAYGVSDAYDVWRDEQLDRDQFVVVGANDGMFHAFDAGTAITAGAPVPEVGYPFTSGTGAEKWAFVPPDLLPKLRYGLDAHTYFVDGSPMVRDVWVDGTGGHPKDGVKQKGEFHTVAILTERGGGQRFTALDITDPNAPAFLWTYPQLCSEDSKLVGQSWSDFLPRPPPVGPVRLKLPTGSGQDPIGRGFEERWVAMLNGGYDPGLVRGRAVFMVDAWTGQPIWRWTDADFKTLRGDAKASMFPVAASIAMVDVGKADSSSARAPDQDGYFDTATWGDLGGNLFTARFYEPGEVDTGTGLVTNWSAARSFEQARKADDTQGVAGRGEFFFMTTNVLDGPARLLTMAGSGNREKLMQQSSACGPDNVMGCCASGCTVATSSTATSFGAGSCSQGGTFQCSGGLLTYTPAATTGCGAGFTCGATTQTVTLNFTCGAAGTTSAPSVPITASLSCGANGVCTSEKVTTSNAAISTSILGVDPQQYRMVSVWSYGAVPSRLFSTPAEARAFDRNRLTDVTFSGCADMPGTTCTLVETAPAQVRTSGLGLATTCRGSATKCTAGSEDPGWMYTYGTFCPLESCTPATWKDERTGAGANALMRCADWSTFRPTGSASGTDPCTASTGTPAELSYLMDVVTGNPREGCGVEDTTPTLGYLAGRQKSAYAPPQNASMRIVVNERGQVSYSTLKIETGAPAEKTSLGTRNSLSDPLYWLEVPRQLHTCRHVDPTTCQ